MSENKHLLGNEPINNFEQDLFNFKHYAEKVKKIIQLNSNNKEPLTFGIYGKWGEGKTSFLNLLRYKIEHFDKNEDGKEYLSYDFNPWRYSNEDEMLFDFFDGIAKKFYVNKETSVQEVGKWISKYGKYLKAVKISATVGMPKILNTKIEFNPDEIFKALGEDLKGEKISLDFFKNKINEAIKKTNFKIIVFIDDLDRLDKNEIYTILKLIKLNASFDNFIFITTIDSEHVAKAIKDRYGNDIEDGYLFLEKIINIPIYLPKIENDDLIHFFEIKFSEVLSALPFISSQNKNNLISEVRINIFNANFVSPREIIKILNSFYISAFAIGEEVNLVDLFWLQWIKIKHNDVYAILNKYDIYSEKVFLAGDRKKIDFNDDIKNYKDNPNGLRLYFEKEHKSIVWFLDLCFPDSKNSSNVYQRDINKNINLIEHYEKYFSYHVIGKIPQAEVNLIDKSIEKLDEVTLENSLISFLDKHESYKALYKIETLIHFYSTKQQRYFFYFNLFKNINLFHYDEIYRANDRVRIIELIASILSKVEENITTEIVELSQLLDIRQMCYFVRKFNSNHYCKKELEKILSKRARREFFNEKPFFLNPFDMTNKMIIHYWSNYSYEEFNEYLKLKLTDLNSVKVLIRNFAPYWNDSFLGTIDKSNYEYLKKLIDVKLLISLIEKFSPNLIELKMDLTNDSTDESSIDDNLNQFIYWFQNEKDMEERELRVEAFGSNSDKSEN